ncbi:hypothetical protein N9L68_03305 [bacterium]|nr:hypothetical protein [bacterium]
MHAPPAKRHSSQHSDVDWSSVQPSGDPHALSRLQKLPAEATSPSNIETQAAHGTPTAPGLMPQEDGEGLRAQPADNGKQGDACFGDQIRTRASEPQNGYGKAGECCGQCCSALTSGDRPSRVPTGCGGAPVRPASSAGPSLEPNGNRIVCTSDSAPAVSPASAPTGLQEARHAATADAITPSGKVRLNVQNSTNQSHISELRVPGTLQRDGCHRNTAYRDRLASVERHQFLAGIINVFKEAMQEVQEVQSYPI